MDRWLPTDVSAQSRRPETTSSGRKATALPCAARAAVRRLQAAGIDAGPCGAASLAGLRTLLAHPPACAAVPPDATVLLILTESRAANPISEAHDDDTSGLEPVGLGHS